MSIFKYCCGLREKEIEVKLSDEVNRLKHLRSIISKDIRVKPKLITISLNNQILLNDDELLSEGKLYQANIIPEFKQYNFLVSSKGGKFFFECTLEEYDLVQDLIDQIDQFLAQNILEKFDSYQLIQKQNDQQNSKVNIEWKENQIIGELFQETNVQLEIKLVHEILTLKQLTNTEYWQDISISRNKTLLDLKSTIEPNQKNIQLIINGQFPAQNFDNRLIKDVFQHQDTIFIIQAEEIKK